VALGPDPAAADVVRAALVSSVTRILRHDPGVRIGDDPEDVHQARVGTRRLRSDLRTFGPILLEEWLGPLREGVGGRAGELGAVGAADVPAERRRGQADAPPARAAAGLAPLFRRLAKEREEAGARLGEAMSGARYIDLLDRLVTSAQEPAVRPEAALPAAPVLPEVVAAPRCRLRQGVS